MQSINKEGFVQKEIRIALDAADEKPEGTIFIIPIRLEECSVPERISQFHWVDLFEKDGYEHLFKALQLRAHSLGIVINRETNALPSLSSAINEVSFPAYSSFQKDLERLIQEAENGFINIKRDETQSVLDGYINYDSKFTFEYSINNRIWKREEGGWYFTCTFCERTNLQQAEKVFNERVQEIKPLLINNWKFEEHDKSNSLYRKTFEAIRRYNTLKIKNGISRFIISWEIIPKSTLYAKNLEQFKSKLSPPPLNKSVHLTLGILRQSQAVSYALVFFWLDGFAVPAPAQVTQTVRLFA